MKRDEIYEAWAPADAIWSQWAKPVLFAHTGGYITQPTALPTIDTSWAAPADGATAYVIDLPALHSAVLGIELATKGFRPVPLFNACPSPGASGTGTFGRGAALVDLHGCIDALEGGAPILRSTNLPPDAPPAFLLDSQRRYGTSVHPAPGMFDNRSVSLPTDFPSANMLLSRGVKRIVLVQDQHTEPQADLAHSLLRWQDAGAEIAAMMLMNPAAPTPIHVVRPPMYRRLFQRLFATIGLRRAPLGGFGGFLPIPSSS